MWKYDNGEIGKTIKITKNSVVFPWHVKKLIGSVLPCRSGIIVKLFQKLYLHQLGAGTYNVISFS
jgi:hypothetical protein